MQTIQVIFNLEVCSATCNINFVPKGFSLKRDGRPDVPKRSAPTLRGACISVRRAYMPKASL